MASRKRERESDAAMKRRAGLYGGGLCALSSQGAVSESNGTPQVADKADGPRWKR
jgi:hypothetical protein